MFEGDQVTFRAAPRLRGVRIACRAVAIAALVVACARVPVTGRFQLLLVSDADAARLGAQAFAEVLRESPVLHGGPAVEQVLRVGRRLAAASGLTADWRFAVIEDEQKNAFALPGGKVAVYTGILRVTQSDAGLAVVLGHEIGHVLARHGAERLSQGLAAQLGGTVLALALGAGPNTETVLAAYGLGAEYGVLRPFGRAQEAEADEIGLVLMARAGYDPREALAFWERMERATGARGATPEFLSTHPSYGTRVRLLREKLPAALRLYEAGGPTRPGP